MTAAAMSAAALWLHAWLAGSASADDLLEQLGAAAADSPALVCVDDGDPELLPALLKALRSMPGARGWLLLPRPGRPGGWPRDVPGQPAPSVLVTFSGSGGRLLRPGPRGWRWDGCAAVSTGQLEAGMLTPRAGARALAEVAVAAAERLERLGLDRPATGARPRRWEEAMSSLPGALDPAAQSLLVRLGLLHDALDLARAEAGAAVTAAEARARADELRSVTGLVEDVICGAVNGVHIGAQPPPTGR